VTIRQVTPANGAAQLMIAWDGGSMILLSGQVLDVPPGGPLEAAIGAGNLTALSGAALANVQGGSDPTGTANA
jgi:hypothetical protein